MPNAKSDLCSLCDLKEVGDLMHCPYNRGAGQFLIDKVHQVLPNVHHTR